MLTFAVVAIASAPRDAHAVTYCVLNPACVAAGGTTQADFQAALNTAAGTAGLDRIELGPELFTRATGFSYVSANPVQIVGTAGVTSWSVGFTRLRNSTADPSDERVLRLEGSTSSSVSNVAIELPAGTGDNNIGLRLADGTADQIHVQSDLETASSSMGAQLVNGTITRSVIVNDAMFGSGVEVVGGSTNNILDSTITGASTGVQAHSGTSLSVERSTLSSDGSGLRIEPGASAIANSSVFQLVGRSSYAPAGAVTLTNLAGSNSSAEITNSTMIGNGRSSVPAINMANGTNRTIDVTLRNSVISGWSSSVTRTATAPSVSNITTINSAYAPFADSANGIRSETGRLEATDLGLLDDLRLSATSRLIDAGTNTGAPATDRAGQVRIVDGNSDCDARADIGAFEFHSAARAPRAVAAASIARTAVTKPVTFTAAGSCDADGDALTYTWNFGDGTTGSGVTAQHAYNEAGRHTAELIVTDASGRTSSAVARVLVLPRFAGASVATAKVAQRAGIVRVIVRCPATALGPCTGKLSMVPKRIKGARSLPALGSRTFTVGVGATITVPVKLTRSGLAALRARKSLTTIATLVTDDTSGVRATTKRTILVRR